MKLIKNIFIWMCRIVLLGACAMASVFLIASAYESLYNRSLPFVHTLDNITLRPVTKVYDLDKAFNQSKQPENTDWFGNFGKPTNLKLPGRTKKIDIVQSIHDPQGHWLARANTMHLLVPENIRNDTIGVTLLYCRSSFRTIDTRNLPAENSNIFIDTDHDWRYVFKITSVQTILSSEDYVPADNGRNSKLLIICDDQKARSSTIIEANLLSVQGIEQ